MLLPTLCQRATDRSERPQKLLECWVIGVSNFSLFEAQTFRNEDAVQSVEEELHQQCKQGSGDCALQNRAGVIQIESADNWFSQSPDPDERGQRRGTDVNDGAGFYPCQDRARG